MKNSHVSGMSLIELFLAMAIVGILLLPITKFMTGIFKGLLNMDNRYKNENMTIKSVVDIERDFKDMNEVSYCDATKLIFFMDSYRAPNYQPNGDNDGDGIPNRTDTDDDGDGFDHVRVASDFAGVPLAAARFGWKQGLDLQDDDEDGDGRRDVQCTYWYDAGAKTLNRKFHYNYNGVSTTADQVVLSGVVAFAFTPSGSFATRDPITGNPPDFIDSNVDGVLDVGEMGGFPLDTFQKTRYITTVAYTMTIRPNPARPETFVVKSSVRPFLMAVKEKYR